jgi:hypothetical protein
MHRLKRHSIDHRVDITGGHGICVTPGRVGHTISDTDATSRPAHRSLGPEHLSVPDGLG